MADTSMERPNVVTHAPIDTNIVMADMASQTITFSEGSLASLLREAAYWLDMHPSANVWHVVAQDHSEDGDDSMWAVSITRQRKIA